MPDLLPLVIGAAVEGLDHFHGEVERVVLDPTGAYAESVSVRPRHAGGPARLVPVGEIGRDSGVLTLARRWTEFEELPEDPAGRGR